VYAELLNISLSWPDVTHKSALFRLCAKMFNMHIPLSRFMPPITGQKKGSRIHANNVKRMRNENKKKLSKRLFDVFYFQLVAVAVVVSEKKMRNWQQETADWQSVMLWRDNT
jgi:hypothetical protein